MEMCYLEWDDSTSFGGWQNIKDSKNVVPDFIRSVGFILEETLVSVTLIQSHTNRTEVDDQVDNLICIPKSAIRERRTVLVKRGSNG